MSRAFLMILSCFYTIQLCGQGSDEIIDERSTLKDRIYVGGGISNIAISENFFSMGLSPIVGYKFTDRLSAGVGITYIYYNYKLFDYKTTVYGGQLFGRYNITEQFFTNISYESISFEVSSAGDFIREWVPGLFVGGGLYQPLGKNAGYNIGVAYNLLFRENSPYASPWVIRAGLSVSPF